MKRLVLALWGLCLEQTAHADVQLYAGVTLGVVLGGERSEFVPGLRTTVQHLAFGSSLFRPNVGGTLTLDAPGLRRTRISGNGSLGVMTADVADQGFLPGVGAALDAGLVWDGQAKLQPLLGGHMDTLFLGWGGHWMNRAGTTWFVSADAPLLGRSVYQ